MKGLPTSIVAPPVTPGVPVSNLPEWIRLNEFFDHPLIIGIPIWVFICLFFFIILLWVNLSWVFKIRRLASVRGYRDVQKKASQEDVMTWMINKTQKLTIECLRYVDSVISYYDQTKISKWHHNTPMSVMHVGGYPAMLVSDDYDQTRDPVSEIALCHACEEFNADQNWWAAFRDAMHNKNLTLPDGMEEDTVAKPLESFSDYRERGRFLLQLKYPDGIPIPAYSIFNPTKFRKFFPKGRSAGFQGGRFIRQARKLNLGITQASFWAQVLPLGVLITMGVIAIIAAWMAPIGK